jgi:hypothetical protein
MVEGMNSGMIYCKNFCKCHNVPPPSTAVEKEILLFNFKYDKTEKHHYKENVHFN